MRHTTLLSLLAAAALPTAWSCGSGAGRDAARTASARSGAPARQVVAATRPEGCDLIPRDEAERILGPLDGPPRREGTGCWYYVPLDTLSPAWTQLRESKRRLRETGADSQAIELYAPSRAGLFVDVDVTGAALVRARGVAAATKAMVPGETESRTTGRPAGWDAVSTPLGRPGFTGRVGHVTVTITLQQLRMPVETLTAIAGRVRDRIPDRPLAHPAAGPTPSPGRDPCGVLTREQAEAVLGKLVVAPFRTHDRSPLADPAGPSCGYFTPGHHVLVLTPEWTYGRSTVDVERMGSNVVSQVADVSGGVAADTLEGPWDDIQVGLSGDLVLLKGARALSIGYLMSSADLAGAIKLAGPALERLAAAKAEAGGPTVAAGGCPLSVEEVGKVIEEPVRLMFNGMRASGLCSYALESDPTVTLELSVKPARGAEALFDSVQSRAKITLGSSAGADRIDVGDGGWAFGSRSGSEAATRAGETLYHARMNYPLSTTIPNRKEAMVQLVRRMLH